MKVEKFNSYLHSIVWTCLWEDLDALFCETEIIVIYH